MAELTWNGMGEDSGRYVSVSHDASVKKGEKNVNNRNSIDLKKNHLNYPLGSFPKTLRPADFLRLADCRGAGTEKSKQDNKKRKF